VKQNRLKALILQHEEPTPPGFLGEWLDRQNAEVNVFRIDLDDKVPDPRVPVLGLCFGGQLLARALGGESFRSNRAEIGWLPIKTNDPDLVSEGPWFNWHFDTFTLPPGAKLIAQTDVGPQAYVIGRSLGLQFHPEVTTEIMESWVKAYRHELDGDGVDPDALLGETYRLAPAVRQRSERLFNRFLNTIARLRPEAARGR
jgi:hypothetical protein